MTNYTVIKDREGNVQSITRHTEPAASIPVCEGNSDYSQYLDDVANGVSVDEVVMPEPTTTPSAEERLSAAEDVIAAIIEGAI